MNHEKKIAELLEIIEKNPELLAARNKAREETLGKRRKAADALERIEKQWATDAKKLNHEVEIRKEKIAEALQKLQALQVEHAEAVLSRMSAGHRHDCDVSEQRQVLLGSYDPEIDSAVEFFKEKVEWLRRGDRFQTSAELDEPRNFFGQIMETVLFKKRPTTNAVAITEAVEYCQKAIHELSSMKLQPEANIDRIEELRRGIPSIDKFTPAMEFPKKSPITGELENVA